VEKIHDKRFLNKRTVSDSTYLCLTFYLHVLPCMELLYAGQVHKKI
jgi:hypothetical protein